jgi:nucleotide-binding universal stress UspA family protein
MNVQRILFPTDFSELSKAAETSACDLADQFGAELHVLHVLNDLFLTMPQTAAALLISPESLDDVITSAEVEIQKIPTPAWASGKKVVRAVRIGTTYDTIVQYAKDNAIDLIVIGTHGRTGLPHVLLGSIAERVVQHAPCSVLTVRSECPAKVKQIVARQPVLKTA